MVRVRRSRAVAALLLAACGAGCTAPAGPSADPARHDGASATPPAATERTSSSDPEHRAPPISIAFAGDVHFEGALAQRLREPATALAPAAGPLRRADVAVVNLETSVGTGGRPEPGKRFTFSAGPAALDALAAAGVDVAVMANNHALDFGRDRLPSTLRAARQAASADPPLAVVGIGRNAAEAFRPALSETGSATVATLAASVADQDPTADPTSRWAAGDHRSGIADAMDPARLLAAVRHADRDAGVVVTYLHWGIQGESCPSAQQRTLASRLVEAGADVVVGAHAHVLQGDGRLGPGYVAYGLGNFAWYSPGRTGVLTLTVRPPGPEADRARVVRSSWWPAAIGVDGLAAPLRGPAVAEFAADLSSLRACAGLRR